VLKSPKGGEFKMFKDANPRLGIKENQQLLSEFISRYESLIGPSAEQIIPEDRDTIQEQRQRVDEAEKQQREVEAIAAEREKQLREIEKL